MKALQILESINERMTKKDMLRLIAEASKELEFFDINQVAEMLDEKAQNIRARVGYWQLGTRVGSGRIYSREDIKKLESLKNDPQATLQPNAAVRKVDKMQAMRDEGATLGRIAKAFDVSESYVSKLLTKNTVKLVRSGTRNEQKD